VCETWLLTPRDENGLTACETVSEQKNICELSRDELRKNYRKLHSNELKNLYFYNTYGN
jgi:hypothetical protein